MSDNLAHKGLLQSEFAAIRTIADLVADLSHEQVLRVFGYVADLKAKSQARDAVSRISDMIRETIASGEISVSACDCPRCQAVRAAANPPKH